ncbi:P4H7 [Symbiodinium pilosum]|uniref:P4H7 protein n=1 Tax=Symbiodinium pilosum TaxID=2952 RepID=A0A812XSG4_SYMPI|nr:P4H7 [Symbiodinium pilosum]
MLEATHGMGAAIRALPGKLLDDPVPVRLVPDVITKEQGEAVHSFVLPMMPSFGLSPADAVLEMLRERMPFGLPLLQLGMKPQHCKNASLLAIKAVLSAPRMFENAAVKAVRAWASNLLRVPEDHVEALQLVRYQKGEQYSTHVDWGRRQDASLWLGGQRTATALIYLNSLPDDCGGETSFERLGVTVQPRAGAALVWPNVDERGQPQDLVEHRALCLGNGRCTSCCSWRSCKLQSVLSAVLLDESFTTTYFVASAKAGSL